MSAAAFPAAVQEAFDYMEAQLVTLADRAGVPSADVLEAYRANLALAREVGRDEHNQVAEQVRSVLEEFTNPEAFLR